MKKENKNAGGRLFCLDLLRGMDMMLLLVAGPLVNAFHKAWGLPDAVMG